MNRAWSAGFLAGACAVLTATTLGVLVGIGIIDARAEAGLEAAQGALRPEIGRPYYECSDDLTRCRRVRGDVAI